MEIQIKIVVFYLYFPVDSFKRIITPLRLPIGHVFKPAERQSHPKIKLFRFPATLLQNAPFSSYMHYRKRENQLQLDQQFRSIDNALIPPETAFLLAHCINTRMLPLPCIINKSPRRTMRSSENRQATFAGRQESQAPHRKRHPLNESVQRQRTNALICIFMGMESHSPR